MDSNFARECMRQGEVEKERDWERGGAGGMGSA